MKPLLLVRTGGPQPEYDVMWTRGTIKIAANGRIYYKGEAQKVNRRGRVAVSSCGWKRIRLSYLTLEQYVERMKLQGFKEVEQ